MRCMNPSISSAQGKSPQLQPSVAASSAGAFSAARGAPSREGGVSVSKGCVGVKLGDGVAVSVDVRVRVGVSVGDGVTVRVGVGVSVRVGVGL